MKRRRLRPIMLALCTAAFACAPTVEPVPMAPTQITPLDLGAYSDAKPIPGLRLLFIHHSCGGQLLAPAAIEDEGEACIYKVAANGGGLRPLLVTQGYEVHEASYGSKVGDKTDIFDWLPKFTDQMELIARVDRQDTFYEDARRNQIVMFKSCYPNSQFVGAGVPPGDAQGPELTVENAKATYRALLEVFLQHPEKLFVVVTAPPRVFQSVSWAKDQFNQLRGRPSFAASGGWAREFNRWLTDSKQGWLLDYAGTNVAVFDYYDVLTGYGKSDFSIYGSGLDNLDDHPSRLGNETAAKALVPWLNRAVRRARLVP